MAYCDVPDNGPGLRPAIVLADGLRSRLLFTSSPLLSLSSYCRLLLLSELERFLCLQGSGLLFQFNTNISLLYYSNLVFFLSTA